MCGSVNASSWLLFAERTKDQGVMACSDKSPGYDGASGGVSRVCETNVQDV